MSFGRYWVLALFFALPAAPAGAAEPLQNDVLQAITSIQSLTFVRSIRLAGLGTETFHPQGLKLVGSELYLTTVEGRSSGHGYLLHFHLNDPDEPTQISYKERVQFDAGPEGHMNHAGGLDLDGDALLVPLAVYDAKGPSRILRVPLNQLDSPQTVAVVNDHVGAITAFAETLYGFNWNSKKIYRQTSSDAGFEPALGGDGWAYQDCKAVASPYALCTGLKGLFNLSGAIRLIDLSGSNKTVSGLWSMPVARVAPDGSSGGVTSLAQNAFDFQILRSPNGSIREVRFYFVPHDDDETSLMIYSAR